MHEHVSFLAREFRQSILLAMIWIWRRCMFRTTFIAVTGSLGKTSCKDAISAVLASRFPTVSTTGSANHFGGITKTVLRVRPWTRYAVVEVGIVKPGQMKRFARALKPDIAVWISVARTHTMNFKSLETTAREKSMLVEGIRSAGVAILNDDNPHIAAYQPPASIRAIYFGTTSRSAYSATGIDGKWPELLSFTLTGSGEYPVRVSTRFLGSHWIGSLLPAFIVGREAGISVADAAAALAGCEPMQRRMSPVGLSNGATIIRDEVNGSVDSLGAALAVFEEARAERKIIVFTDVSDSSQKPRIRVRNVGRAAARIADGAMFLGEHAEYGARAALAGGLSPGQVWSFVNIGDGAKCLKRELRPGDLVLLRGRRVDHLQRVFLSLTQDVSCWRNRCNKRIDCMSCSLLNAAPRGEGFN